MTRLKECFQEKGISIYYISAEAVNTGHDNGYSESNAIKADDVHFAWSLGRFLMTGFTRQTSDDNGNPIFIKTLGDDVTLWFELDQDIDRLDDKDTLSINEDTNGFNEHFGIAKTNFGRGTLIIRHTNYQNATGKPQVYTNYLAAKATSGADTRVILHEEGDYEVTLNYEIRSTSTPLLGSVISNYTNYSITFKFSVRNGNCMVYPFDVVTGAELSNSAVTENGFYLDLAKSRYLDINVKRSVIAEGAAGGLV